MDDMANLYVPDKDIFMLDVPTWLAPTIPSTVSPYSGHGPQVPYHGPDLDLVTYNSRPDDNPRPLKFFQGEGHRWGVGPSVAWHGHTPTEMDYILGRLD
jgi:hypothetical protein